MSAQLMEFLLIFLIIILLGIIVSVFYSILFKKPSPKPLSPQKIKSKDYTSSSSPEQRIISLEERLMKLENEFDNLKTKNYSYQPRTRQNDQVINNNLGKIAEFGIQPDRYNEPHPEPPANRNRHESYPRRQENYDVSQIEREKTNWEGEYRWESLYNQSIDNREMRREFMENYHPTRIGVKNSMDRMKDPSIEPDFQDANQGDYWAVSLKSGNQLYAVFPIFDVPLQDSNYDAGAMGKVYECDDYDRRFRYKIIKVLKAAIFEKKTGNKWILKRNGKLKLEKRDD